MTVRRCNESNTFAEWRADVLLRLRPLVHFDTFQHAARSTHGYGSTTCATVLHNHVCGRIIIICEKIRHELCPYGKHALYEFR